MIYVIESAQSREGIVSKRQGRRVYVEYVEVGQPAELPYVDREGVLVTSPVEYVAIEDSAVLFGTNNTFYKLTPEEATK